MSAPCHHHHPPHPPSLVLLLLLVLLIFAATAPTPARAWNAYPTPRWDTDVFVQARKYARIPDVYSREERERVRPHIQATVPWRGSLFVVTSTSASRIYRVRRPGAVSLWFDVRAAMRADNRDVDESNEQHSGLRAVAFHPTRSSRRFYVAVMERHSGNLERHRYLSRPRDGEGRADADAVVLEFRYIAATLRPVPGSLREVLRVGMPVYDHPIKQIAFRGRLLYISHGDGSVQSAEVGGGQNRNDALGKILRIDPLRRTGARAYGIPAGNPYRGDSNYLPELFAIGFRNPHNICFSRRGELFVADSGRDNVEEINIVRAGGNYGWSEREGHFVHREGGGIRSGISDLPGNDASFGYEYPNAVLGHEGNPGDNWIGFAVAGSCPIENGSPLSGKYLYANFAVDGQLYYSNLRDMRNAVTSGPPRRLTYARTFRVRIEYDHDRNRGTAPVVLDDLRDVTNYDDAVDEYRTDVRFGQGEDGEIYFTSKSSGWVYLITNSVAARRRRR